MLLRLRSARHGHFELVERRAIFGVVRVVLQRHFELGFSLGQPFALVEHNGLHIVPFALTLGNGIENILRLVVLAVADKAVDLTVIAAERACAVRSFEVCADEHPRFFQLLQLTRALVALLARLEPLLAVKRVQLVVLGSYNVFVGVPVDAENRIGVFHGFLLIREMVV